MKLSKQQVFESVVQKAWEDNAFKTELVNNPVQAIEKLTGEKINLGNRTFVVRDQTDTSKIYINIPHDSTVKEGELTDEQLEAVAGGGWWYDQFHAAGTWVRELGDDDAIFS